MNRFFSARLTATPRFLRTSALAALLLTSCRQPRVVSVASAPVAHAAVLRPALTVVEHHARPAHESLVDWVERAPLDSAAWIARQPVARSLDDARAALATQPDFLVFHPDLAPEQARQIVDPDLRRATIFEVICTWHEFDPATAWRRLGEEKTLEPIERAHLGEMLADTRSGL